MKKRLAAFGAMLLLILVLTVPAFAVEVPPASGKPASTRLYPLLVDDAQLLSEEEETALVAKLEEISARQEMDVAVITVSNLDGRSVEEYTDDFYDYFGYGQGSTRDGVMLLISMEERTLHMTAAGRGIRTFTDAGRDYILDHSVMPLIGEGAYAGAFDAFADQCDEFITQAKTGKPYDGSFMPKGRFKPLGAGWLVISVLIGGVVTLIVSMVLKSEMKTVAPERAANNYAVDGSLTLTRESDRFITTNVTRTPRAKESGGSGSSGSTTHTSSSGTTHSGTSRNF